MGFIGMGTQNRYLLKKFLDKNTQVVAVCDVDTTRRESAKQMVEDAYAQKAVAGYKGCTAYGDFRELLARKDIDAVCIASPDHWHAIIRGGGREGQEGHLLRKAAFPDHSRGAGHGEGRAQVQSGAANRQHAALLPRVLQGLHVGAQWTHRQN